MPNYNQLILIGHASKDPEIRYTPTGTPITSFSVAWNRNYKQGEEWQKEAHFFDVVIFREVKDLTKGAAVLVEGRLSQDRWKTDDGQMRSKVKIVANKVYVLGKKDSGPAIEGEVLRDGEVIDDTPF